MRWDAATSAYAIRQLEIRVWMPLPTQYLALPNPASVSLFNVLHESITYEHGALYPIHHR
jgi:hypothetical protein